MRHAVQSGDRLAGLVEECGRNVARLRDADRQWAGDRIRAGGTDSGTRDSGSLVGENRCGGFYTFRFGCASHAGAGARADYLQPDALGIPQREDGTDTFGHYQNGGITAGQVLHFLAAHYVVERPERADRVLRAMLQRQMQGGFQNGVRDAGNQGIDWTDWQGNPTGYEGYLADSFRFLQAVLLREATFCAKFYRPLYPDREGGSAAMSPSKF